MLLLAWVEKNFLEYSYLLEFYVYFLIFVLSLLHQSLFDLIKRIKRYIYGCENDLGGGKPTLLIAEDEESKFIYF